MCLRQKAPIANRRVAVTFFAMASFAPATLQASRNGKKLNVPRGASLPAQCVKCGAAAQKPWRKKFYWHAPWLFILVIFPGLLIYAIVALIVRKSMELNVPLCDRHHSDRKRFVALGAVMLIGFIPVGAILAGIGIDGGYASLVALAMFIVGVVFYMKAQFLRPVKIDEQGGTFLGGNEEFLRGLPASTL